MSNNNNEEKENEINVNSVENNVGANVELPEDFVDETFEYNDEDENFDTMVRFVDDDVVTLTEMQRLKCLFTAPKKLFTDIKYKPNFEIPAIIVTIIIICSTFVTQKLTPLVLDAQREGILLSKGIDIEPIISATKTQSTSLVSTGISLVTSIIMISIIAAFSSLIYKLFSKMFGGTATFKQFFSRWFYISIITSTISLISALIQVALQTPVDILSLAGVFAPNGNITEISYILLSSISIPTIYALVLNIIAFTTLNEFKSNVKGIVVCVLITVITLSYTIATSYFGIMALSKAAEMMN